MDSFLFAVWREEIGASAEVRFGRMSTTVKWEDGLMAAEQGVSRLFLPPNASHFDWHGVIDGFAAKAKDEVGKRTANFLA